MLTENTYPLKSDEQYRRLIAPLRDDEKYLLAKEIASGTNPVIRVWHSTILADYPLYDYCLENDISYAIEKFYPSCNEAAISWICTDQLSNRYLSDEMRWYLIGKRCLCEYILGAHAFASRKSFPDTRKQGLNSRYDTSITRTRDRIANEYKVSIASVIKYESYSQAIDVIYEISEDLARAILNGVIPTSFSSVINLADESPDLIREYAEKLLNPDPENAGGSEISRLVVRRRAKKMPKQNYEPKIAIKDMPPYDRDAEITTLSLTIPSWINSMKRVRTSTELSQCTLSASRQLHSSLIDLISATALLIGSIKEDSHG